MTVVSASALACRADDVGILQELIDKCLHLRLHDLLPNDDFRVARNGLVHDILLHYDLVVDYLNLADDAIAVHYP